MDAENHITAGRHFDPVIPEVVISLALAAWQTPIMISTAWWNAVFDAYGPQPTMPHHHVDPHDQLIIPEPIKAEGEHALFA